MFETVQILLWTVVYYRHHPPSFVMHKSRARLLASSVPFRDYYPFEKRSRRRSCDAPGLASMSDTRPPGRFHMAEVALGYSSRKSLRIANVSPPSPLTAPLAIPSLSFSSLFPRRPSSVHRLVPIVSPRCNGTLSPWIWKFHTRAIRAAAPPFF